MYKTLEAVGHLSDGRKIITTKVNPEGFTTIEVKKFASDNFRAFGVGTSVKGAI